MLGLHIFIIFHEILFIWKQGEDTAFQESDSKKFQFSKCTVYIAILFLQLSNKKVYFLAPSFPKQNATSWTDDHIGQLTASSDLAAI